MVQRPGRYPWIGVEDVERVMKFEELEIVQEGVYGG